MKRLYNIILASNYYDENTVTWSLEVNGKVSVMIQTEPDIDPADALKRLLKAA